MLKFFSIMAFLLVCNPVFAAKQVMEIKLYDFPLIYHVVTQDKELSPRMIAYIASSSEYEHDEINGIATKLNKAWNTNKEFDAHDYYDQFMVILKRRIAAISTDKLFSIINKPGNWQGANSLVYNFDKGGFDARISFGSGEQENTPSYVQCGPYTEKMICLSAVNQDYFNFIPMKRDVARAVADLRDQNKLIVRFIFRYSETFQRVKPAKGHMQETIVIPVQITRAELYQADDKLDPVKLLTAIDYVEEK